MIKKKALVTGISGQDGSYLSEYLLENDYDVYGILRRHSTAEHQRSRIDHINNQITTFYGDVSDPSSINNIMSLVMPDEIYNLAAQSHVRISFDVPEYTVKTNALGVLNMLEAYRQICPDAQFYQASSSEMFGNSIDSDGYQRESTPMNPVSPYGCSKVFAYNLVRHYRNAYGLFAVNGILFNHESPRRGSNFVTSKVVKAAVEISKGLSDELVLGNMDSYRDWGHSKDYVRAMHMILNHTLPEDVVVSTGETHSVREMCDYVFSQLGMNYKDYIRQDEKYIRPEELKYLKGDCSKLKTIFDWAPEYSFETLMDDMINYWKEVI